MVDLTDRQVYFKIPRAKAKQAKQGILSGICDLTPNKLYRVLRVEGNLFYIWDDKGYTRTTRLKNPACLYGCANWIVKRESKGKE